MDATTERNALARDIRLIFGPVAGRIGADDLKRAYRLKAHECHPDKAASRGLDPDYLALRFIKIQEAYFRIRIAMDEGGLTLEAAPRPAGSAPREAHRPRVFHAGGLPPMKLRLGQFLYYTRRIDWETLIASLAWQFASRPKLGELGMDAGYLSRGDVMDVLKRKGALEYFGATAVREGALDPFGLTVLMGRQRLIGMPLGSYFVERGHLSARCVDAAVETLRGHNLRAAAASA